MILFNQLDFSRGMDAEFDRTKAPEGTYPLLVNGRARDGVIRPVNTHKWHATDIPGNYQDLVVVGDYLVLVVSGEIYHKHLPSDGAWQKITGWTALNASADIYSKIVPVTTNVYNRAGQAIATLTAVNPQIAPTVQALFITDGINRPRAIFYNLAFKELNTYSEWTQDDPEYVPVCTLPIVGNNKLYVVSPDKKKIYQSVTNRYFDFVINVQSNGDKGGDADTFATAVDFNDLTGVFPIDDGGLLATTDYASYLLYPSTTLFAEPVYTSKLAFPVGAVNSYSFASLIGDTAFISSSGLHSINVSKQLNSESNNFPFSKSISRYLTPNQTDTAAVNFDDYAMFSMNTVVGRAVVVYDTVREAFVSLDTDFGIVKRFAVYRKDGVSRLFFINKDNQLGEAYAGDSIATARLLIGDMVSYDSGLARYQKVDEVLLAFNNITTTGKVRIRYYCDGAETDASEHTVSASTLVTPPPAIIPFLSSPNSATLAWSVKRKVGFKSSIYLEWAFDAAFCGLTVKGDNPQTSDLHIASRSQVNDEQYIVLGQPEIHTVFSSTGSLANTPTLTQGRKYYIAGSINLGDRTVVDDVFIPYVDTAEYIGTIYIVDGFINVMDVVEEINPDLLFGVGNFSNGSESTYQRMLALIKNRQIISPASNKDLDHDAGIAWYKRHERYGLHQTPLVDFFFLSGGWDTAATNPIGVSSEIDGTNSTSVQANWLRSWLETSQAKYKVILIGYPPYSDGAVEFTDFRWPFREWGADLVICGYDEIYQRRYINGLHYITCGNARDSFSLVPPADSTAVVSHRVPGYLSIRPSEFSLDVTFHNLDKTPLDGVTIFPRRN